MREVVISVNCDACRTNFKEREEGANLVLFTILGEKWEMDLCNDCLGSGFLQEARRTVNRKSDDKSFACHCGKTFGTQRGLSAHQTRQAHD